MLVDRALLVPAVGLHVVEIEDADVGGRVADHTAQQAALWLSSSDSCGLSIVSDIRFAIFFGLAGLFMSRTTTPRPFAALNSTSRGKSSVES